MLRKGNIANKKSTRYEDIEQDVILLKTEKNTLENEMISLGSINKRIKLEIEEGNNKISDVRDNISKIEKHLGELEVQYSNYISQINDASKGYYDFQSRLEQAKIDFENYKRKSVSLIETEESKRIKSLDIYKEAVKVLKSEVDNLNLDIKNKQDTEENIISRINIKNQEYKDIDIETIQKQKVLDDLNLTIYNRQEELSSINTNIEILKGKAIELSNTNVQLLDAKNELQSTIDYKNTVFLEAESKKSEIEEKTKVLQKSEELVDMEINRLKDLQNKVQAEGIIKRKLQ